MIAFHTPIRNIQQSIITSMSEIASSNEETEDIFPRWREWHSAASVPKGQISWLLWTILNWLKEQERDCRMEDGRVHILAPRITMRVVLAIPFATRKRPSMNGIVCFIRMQLYSILIRVMKSKREVVLHPLHASWTRKGVICLVSKYRKTCTQMHYDGFRRFIRDERETCFVIYAWFLICIRSCTHDNWSCFIWNSGSRSF